MERHPGDATLVRQPAEKLIAPFARRRFDAPGAAFDRRFASMEFKPVLPRQTSDEPLVLV